MLYSVEVGAARCHFAQPGGGLVAWPQDPQAFAAPHHLSESEPIAVLERTARMGWKLQAVVGREIYFGGRFYYSLLEGTSRFQDQGQHHAVADFIRSELQ